MDNFSVYLEVGKKRTFAGAVDWPGWCRSGRSDEDAIAALLASAPRYAQVLAAAQTFFAIPNQKTPILSLRAWSATPPRISVCPT